MNNGNFSWKSVKVLVWEWITSTMYPSHEILCRREKLN